MNSPQSAPPTLPLAESQGWDILALSPDVNITTLSAPSPPPPPVMNEIEYLWEEGKKKLPTLYNGSVFFVSSLTKKHIEGYWGEFRYLYAQMKKAKLFQLLHLSSLAVVGLLICPEGIVLAQREERSFYMPGYWQSPPAGSVETRSPSILHTPSPVNLSEQLYSEAQEELGLAPHTLSAGLPIVSVTHPNRSIIDLGIPLKTSLSFADIQHQWAKKANKEYSRLALLNFVQLHHNWQQHFSPLSPTTLALISAYRDKTLAGP